MSSYHLPIVLGRDQEERVVIVHLVDDQDKMRYEENRVVFVSPAGRNIPLFRISDQAQLIDLGGGLVRPQFDKGDNLIEVSVGGSQIAPRRANGFWNYRINSGDFDDNVVFRVTIKDQSGNGVTFEGSLHIVRPAAGEMVININADLGSDATQINYFVPGRGAARTNVRLVQCFQQAYIPSRGYDKLVELETREPKFIQQERGTRDFYKTGNITFQIDGDIDADLNDARTLINYINVSAAEKNEDGNAGKGPDTWDKESAFNRKLINIKMLYAHNDIHEVTSPVDDIKYRDATLSSTDPSKDVTDQQNLLQVLQAIYNQLITVSTSAMNKDCKLFSVLLLVPNIYVQENIDLLLYEMSKMNKNGDGRKYDFRIISESDSAFVGIKEARIAGGNQTVLGEILDEVSDSRQKDTFLIIDAGKGTTDFSIVRYNPDAGGDANNSMISLKRGGIVGAGGAIDYVFARVLARQVYKHRNEIVPGTTSSVTKSEFVNRFMTLIENLAPVDQDRMMLIVEMLKKNYDGDKKRTAQVYTCFAGTSAKTVVAALLGDDKPNNKQLAGREEAWKEISQWVWGNQTVGVDKDDEEEIDWVCRTIAETIIKEDIKLDNNKDSLNRQIDYVIFNGRSFLFKPLKKAFMDAIEPCKGIWYENHGFSVYKKRLFPKDSYYNMKIAKLNGINMKAVSVQFEEHDLGVNNNSDLCCMDRIQLEDGVMNQEQFWYGFDYSAGVNSQQHGYYLGYVCNDLAHSFAPRFSQGVTAATISDTRKKLVLMTLFPVSYVPVFDDFDAGTVNPSGPTPSTPTPSGPSPVGPTAGPSIPTSHGGTNGTDNNSLSTPSGNQPGKPTANDDHIDINDL